LVSIEQSILAKNKRFADENRSCWSELGILSLNLVSSPGAGKTSLLVKTLEALRAEMPLWVIEGDQETSNDADRIRQTGVPAIQINTGRGCHLDAHAVGHATADLALRQHGILFIENVGNLVCPAGFDLGEAKRVVILSVTEGTDKPIKYPDAFAAADIMVLSKLDLLPHVDFDASTAIDLAKRVNPTIRVVRTTVTAEGGIDEWLQWLRSMLREAVAAQAAHLENRLATVRSRLSSL
jgi:hydrogenase nickel incorporation protein HypB